MLIPYKVKNPTTRFPYATVAILAVNAIVYALTTDHFLVIREQALRAYSFTWGLSPAWAFFTASFLHGDIFHLGGNMLFLWVFGRAVEDRLGVARFLVVYVIAGFAGDLCQAMLGATSGDPVPTLGASGCIMGLLGAYWYLFSWSPVCVFYFFWIFLFVRVGTFEIAAFWMIALYVLMDVVSGITTGATGAAGSVANFAHVGGAAAGAILCFALGMRRDSHALSKAKATYADVRNLGDLTVSELETMLRHDPTNPAVIRAAIAPANSAGRMDIVQEAMEKSGMALMEKDPELVATYLTDLKGDLGCFPLGRLIWLADNRQHAGDTQSALKLYERIAECYPDTPDMETALCRMAQIHWNANHDAAGARQCIETMLERFPYGPMALAGENLLRQMDQAA